MAVILSFLGGAGWQFFNDNGDPLSGGKIYTYAAGTTTPLTTYTSYTGTTPNTNPIILDAAGRTPEQIWATEGVYYKYVIRNANDVLVRTWDNIGGSSAADALAADLANTTNNAKGDALIGFRQSNNSGFITGAVARTVNAKLQEIVSVKDFGAVGDGITNDSAAVQAAVDAIKFTTGGTIYFPVGTYLCNAIIDGNKDIDLLGDGPASVIKSALNNEFAIQYERTFRTAFLRNLTVAGTNKNTHGAYFNIGSNVIIDNCNITGCGLGIVFNATIDTRITNTNINRNYLGLYYTCRTAAGSPTVTNINGQAYTFTSAFFPQQPGESDVEGTVLAINNIGIVVDQPDNPYAKNSNIKIWGGLNQQNTVGFIGDLGQGGPPSAICGTWFENNNTGTALFNGNTYDATDVYITSGPLVVKDTSLARATIKDYSVLLLENTEVYVGIVKDASASFIGDRGLIFSSVVSANNYVFSPRAPFDTFTKISRTRTPTGNTYRFSSNTKASRKLVNTDTVTFFGAGSSANVVDGVLDVKECKEISLTGANNGVILFTNTGGTVLDKYYVGLISLKLVSGDPRVRLFNIGAGAAFGAIDFTLQTSWRTYVIIKRGSATVATTSSNVLGPVSPTTVVRASGECLVVLDTIEDVAEFLDINAFPLI